MKAKRRRRSRGRLRCVLGFLLFGGLLVATRFSHLWLSFDVLSHFTAHYAILAVAFVIGYFMPFGRVLTAIMLGLIGFAGLGAYAHYASERPRVFGTAQPSEQPLRVMAFNSGFANDNTEAIIREVRRLDPDVATLIELSEGKRVVLDQLKDTYPYRAECIGQPYCHLVRNKGLMGGTATDPRHARRALCGGHCGRGPYHPHALCAGAIRPDARARQLPQCLFGPAHGGWGFQCHTLCPRAQFVFRAHEFAPDNFVTDMARACGITAIGDRSHFFKPGDTGSRRSTDWQARWVRPLSCGSAGCRALRAA
jgi:hypothetical protein